jgi:hypothetical protein
MFDPFLTTKQILKKMGGNVETLTASFVVPEDKTPDVTLMNIGFKWFSGVTPTKEEFLAGRMTLKSDGRETTYNISSLESNVVAEATGAYCVMVGGMWYVVSTVLENELGTLPKTGIYYSISAQLDEGANVTLDFGERIVPIDQKYLPGVCLPVVEIVDISAITAEEGAELGKHIGIPVVIKVTIDGTLNCCIFNYTYVDAYRMHLYGTTIGTDAVILTSSDGVSWAKG